MAITQNTFTGDGSNLGPFSFTFKWLNSTDVKVTVDNVLKTAGTHYNLQGLNYATKSGGQVLFTAGNAPAAGKAIVIFRETSSNELISTFISGSAIRSQDLNDNFVQNLYVTQETSNNSVQDIGNVTLTANYTFTTSPSGPTPTSNSHLATKEYVDGTAFAGIGVGDKGDITVISATSWSIDNAAVTEAKLSFTPIKSNVAQTFTAAQRGAISAIGSTSGTITLDFATANNFSLTLNDNVSNTLNTPTNLIAGQSGVIYITQDGTGSRLLSYHTNWDFAGGTVPTLSTAANAVDVLCYAVRTTGSIAATLIKDVKS